MLDIVANHGSPSWDMRPVDQPKFGEIYDENSNLLADHQNIFPGGLNPDTNPLHRFFNKEGNLAQLSDLNSNNPAVVDYLVGAYLKWISQGADAFRIDTIAWMPHAFWKQFSDRIRAVHPGFFMFGENFNFDAGTIAQHQKPENGAISVLDFPGRSSITQVFQNSNSNFSDIAHYLHLTDCTYTNPYELATFYDNHDMARMSASENGFIDAHNWLFSSRGIPVVYYGSEKGFMAGKAEHSGNRNYYGIDNIAEARQQTIYQQLKKIGNIRRDNIALQKGLQVNLQLDGHKAAFYRVYQDDNINQSALVLLNKGDTESTFTINQFVNPGTWVIAGTDQTISVPYNNAQITTTVAAHDVKVLLYNEPLSETALINHLQQLMRITERCQRAPVKVSPDPLIAGQEATVDYYRAKPGQQIALHWGINNWQGASIPVAEEVMSFIPDEWAYRISIKIPTNANQFDFVFHNLTDNSWENNHGQDWHYQVTGHTEGLQTPDQFSALAGDRLVELSWQAVNNASFYTIYYTANGEDPNENSDQFTTTQTPFTHQPLDNDITYQYRISASNDHEQSPLSETITVIPTVAYKTRLGHRPVLRLTGAQFSGWNPANSDYVLKQVDDYQWEIELVIPTQLTDTHYKLTLNGNWTINWGGGASGKQAQLARGSANATVTLNAGKYILRVNKGNSINSALQVQWVTEGDPALLITPTIQSLGKLALGEIKQFELRYMNSGGALMIEKVTANATWLSHQLDTVHQRIQVTVNTTSLTVGERYTGSISIQSNGGNQIIPVDFSVIAASEQIAITFTCHSGHTYQGQSVYISGSIAELGNWKPESAVKLVPNVYPTWTGIIKLPTNIEAQWKCLKREEQDPTKGIQWQEGSGNNLCSLSSCPSSVSAEF